MFKNYFVFLFYILFLFFNSLIIGHGFDSNTVVDLANGSKKTIYNLCLKSLYNNLSILSYDANNNTIINPPVKIGKKSKSNCYFRLGFDNTYQDPNDMMCSPWQEFYSITHQAWIPAYALQVGDALLTRDMAAKHITYKEFVHKSIRVYMLEIENTHTFFVGKYSILTHNIFLPITASIGFVIPFGSSVTGTACSFFGPIGIIGGLAFGSLFSMVIKSFYDNRIAHYKNPKFDIRHIENNNNQRIIDCNENISIKNNGCFTDTYALENSQVYPIEIPLHKISAGCIEIEILPSNNHSLNTCHKNDITEKTTESSCFPQAEPDQQLSFYSQEKNSVEENKNNSTPKLIARNWKEFEDNCPMGQKYGKKFLHTGKQNPKDGSPIRQLSENIPNAEMFKKGYYFALDRFHDGDHFEVWDKNKKWIGLLI